VFECILDFALVFVCCCVVLKNQKLKVSKHSSTLSSSLPFLAQPSSPSLSTQPGLLSPLTGPFLYFFLSRSRPLPAWPSSSTSSLSSSFSPQCTSRPACFPSHAGHLPPTGPPHLLPFSLSPTDGAHPSAPPPTSGRRHGRPHRAVSPASPARSLYRDPSTPHRAQHLMRWCHHLASSSTEPSLHCPQALMVPHCRAHPTASAAPPLPPPPYKRRARAPPLATPPLPLLARIGCSCSMKTRAPPARWSNAAPISHLTEFLASSSLSVSSPSP
jgi:hypothetical protein